MGGLARPGALALALLAAGSAAGCGDPLVVLGEWPGIVRVVAGIPDSAGIHVDTLATGTPLNSPLGLAADGQGTVYIADQRTARILAVRSDGRLAVLVDHWQCAEAACLKRPDGLALDGRGGLLVADPNGHRIWRLDLASGSFSVVAGNGRAESAPDGTPAGSAGVAGPTGIVASPDGRIFFTETAGHRVRAIGTDGRLATVAGTGISGFSGDGGPATAAELAAPTGLALGGPFLYVADTGNERVRAIDLDRGTIETIAGTGIRAFGGDGGLAPLAQFATPRALGVANDGLTLFIADVQNNRVRAVHLETLVIETFAGTGSEEYNGDGLVAGETALSRPGGLAVSPLNHLFIADTGHNLVRRTALRF